MLQPRGRAVKLLASFGAIGEGPEAGVLVFLEDASAVQQRAQQLKLASLGRLAASIAHEIRNPLGAVSHAGQLLGESPALQPGDERLIRIIRDNTVRMNTIVENVLELGRERKAQRQRLALAGWLGEFAGEFCRDAPFARAALTVTVSPPELEVRFDPAQLRQVLWNLSENAVRHAGAAAALTLRGGLDEDDGRPFLEVQDNGPGITDEVRERLFEPFHTTRARGSGLGLYVSRELCEANQAALNHRPGVAGCVFRITFAPHGRRAGDQQ